MLYALLCAIYLTSSSPGVHSRSSEYAAKDIAIKECVGMPIKRAGTLGDFITVGCGNDYPNPQIAHLRGWKGAHAFGCEALKNEPFRLPMIVGPRVGLDESHLTPLVRLHAVSEYSIIAYSMNSDDGDTKANIFGRYPAEVRKVHINCVRGDMDCIPIAPNVGFAECFARVVIETTNAPDLEVSPEIDFSRDYGGIRRTLVGGGTLLRVNCGLLSPLGGYESNPNSEARRGNPDSRREELYRSPKRGFLSGLCGAPLLTRVILFVVGLALGLGLAAFGGFVSWREDIGTGLAISLGGTIFLVVTPFVIKYASSC